MENEERRIDNIEKKTIVITGISAEMDKDNQEQIKRLSFETNQGAITWKPKIDKRVFQHGFQVIRTTQMTLEELPDKLKTWANIILTEGKLTALVNYSIMTVDRDGEDVSYRFITSAKAFEAWEVLSNDDNTTKGKK